MTKNITIYISTLYKRKFIIEFELSIFLINKSDRFIINVDSKYIQSSSDEDDDEI